MEGANESAEEFTENGAIEAITPIHDEDYDEPAENSNEVAEGEGDDVSKTDAEPNAESEGNSEDAPIEVEAHANESEESVKNTPKATQQAEALKAALRRAQANQKNAGKNQPGRPNPQAKRSNDKSDDKRRIMLLGKKATRTIKADNGDVIVAEGAEITEDVLQKARLANRYIELSMNYTV